LKWQEYEEAVARLYEQMEGIGVIKRNVLVPDKVTGQNRQIDVLLEIGTKGHSIKVLIDAKFHSGPIDVKTVEEVLALAQATGSDKAVIVASNGWTEPAAKKAIYESCDLRLLTLEKALDLVIPEKWQMCDSCGEDCIVMDQDGVTTFPDGTILWWLAGRCRECHVALVWCQDCGKHYWIPIDTAIICACGYTWRSTPAGLEMSSGNVR